MYFRQFWWQFQLVGDCSDSGHDGEWADISGCEFSSGLKSLDSFHRGDSEIYVFSGFEADLTMFGIIVALLSGFGQLQSVSDFLDLLLRFEH